MDLFAPCNFANIQGYPNDFPNNGMDLLPSFQGNNAVSAMAHIKAFSSWLGKYARGVDYNHEDVKMSLFVLSLEEDALDWFTNKPDNSFNSLQLIINAFKDKYVDERRKTSGQRYQRHRAKKNEIVEEFNKSFNGIIKELPQDYRPPAKFLFYCYIDAFDVDTSYELRRAKVNDYKVAQVLAEEIEKDKKAYGISKTPNFDRFLTNLMEKKLKILMKTLCIN